MYVLVTKEISNYSLSQFSKTAYLTKMGRRDSSVRVVIGLEAGRSEVLIPAGVREFFILHNVQDRSTSNSIGTGVTSQEVKQPGRENGQSTPI